MKKLWSRSVWRKILIGIVLLFFAAATLIFIGYRRMPPGMTDDIQAGLAARHISDPDARLRKYLEVRYGSMDDPANRQKAFMDFFNIDHIKALQLLVKHAPDERRQESIHAMSRWIASYRQTLTPDERASLHDKFANEQGAALLHRATAQYNSQSVEYRGQTAVVISELLKTLNSVQTK
jgi:hypothetical protein